MKKVFDNNELIAARFESLNPSLIRLVTHKIASFSWYVDQFHDLDI